MSKIRRFDEKLLDFCMIGFSQRGSGSLSVACLNLGKSQLLKKSVYGWALAITMPYLTKVRI